MDQENSTPGSPSVTTMRDADLDREWKRTALFFHEQVRAFVQVDNAINDNIRQMTSLVTEYARARAGGAGTDNVQLADWVENVIALIRALQQPLKDEKDFFFKIIALVICGCDRVCMCDKGGPAKP